MRKYLYGIDPSMSCTGVELFDMETFKPIFNTSIKTNDKDTHGVRLGHIKKFLEDLTEKYPPEEIAIERGFSRFNTSTQVVYRVHGVINETFKHLDQKYYPSKKVKAAVATGDSSKKIVRERISVVYPHIIFANDDESDACATGITHLVEKYGFDFKTMYKQAKKEQAEIKKKEEGSK